MISSSGHSPKVVPQSLASELELAATAAELAVSTGGDVRDAEGTVDLSDVASNKSGEFDVISKEEGKLVHVKANDGRAEWATLKRYCQNISNNKWFDRLIMFAILFNSLLMALADYDTVNEEGELVQKGSFRNYIIEEAELYFLALFTIEMCIKMVALNMRGENSYFSDSWNWLDSAVVVSGWVALVPNVPSVSVIRTCRALRPLRSINSFPSLKALVICILSSIPQLASVMVLLGFLFILFGIGGVQIFGGPSMHSRCRLTPWPVTYDWQPGFDDPMNTTFQCVPTVYENRAAVNFDVEADDLGLAKEDSPWAVPQACYWPIDTSEDMERLCALPGTGGYHECYHDTTAILEEEWRWCGSDYDGLGNLRFEKDDEMVRGTYIFSLNWGMTNFDHLLRACVTIFQSITEEGWSDIMYQVQDSNGGASTFFFVCLIIFGAFFVLQLLLAVLEDNFADATTEVAKEKKTAGMMPYLVKFVDIVFPFPWEEWPWRVKLRTFVNMPIFDKTITMFIMLNTIALSMDHYPIDLALADWLEAVNFFLTVIFTLEMISKLLGLGFLKYVEDSFNVFDGLVVLLSISSTILAPPLLLFGGERAEEGGGSISVLRSFRLFRVFKLITKNKKMKSLLTKIIKTVGEMSSFAVLLFLFIYIFTLIGMQFFGNRFRFNDRGYVIAEINNDEWLDAPDRPRSNFDGFTNAFATTFQIITTENWNNVMYDCWRCMGPAGILYPLSIVLLGNFILKNLFLAILLHHFSKHERDENGDDNTVSETEGSNDDFIVEDPMIEHGFIDRNSSLGPSEMDKMIDSMGEFEEMEQDENDFTVGAYEKLDFSKQVGGIFPLNPQPSLGIFGPLNPIRDFAARCVANPLFDKIVLVLIMVSTVTLIMDNPLDDPKSTQVQALGIFDGIMTWLFTLEMAIKVVAIGFVGQEGAYLRNGWNVLDFIIVNISVLGFFTEGSSAFKGLKAMRALRGLRPLRMINRAPGLKVVVNSLLAAIPDVCNVAAICALFLLIFGIFGVSTFKGQFHSCGGDGFEGWGDTEMYYKMMEKPLQWERMTAAEKAWFGDESDVPGAINQGTDCTRNGGAEGLEPCCSLFSSDDPATSMDVCLCWGGEWLPVVHQQFDHVILAMISFFEVSTTEGWVDIMYAAVDSTGIEMQPIRDYNPFYVYFFVVFMVISNFLAVNLFVGVVIDNFNAMKQKVEDGSLMFLSPEQREWMKTQQMTRHLKPTRVLSRPDNNFMGLCYDIDQTWTFEYLIQICIILNTVVMAMQYLGQSDVFTFVLFAFNLAFALIFTAEMVIKMSSQRWDYFKSAWNRFDCVLTIVNDFGIVLALFTQSNSGMVIGVIRTFRVVRVIRAMNKMGKVNQLIDTLIFTLPGLANIAALLTLLFIIYGVMGVQFFAKAAFVGSYNVHANFRTFGTAIVTLLRLCTGEAWGNFMYDLADSVTDCQDDPDYDASMCGFNDGAGCVPLDGCGTSIAFPYFISFTLLVSFVYLNLFIGYILEGFSAASKREEGIRPQDFPKFAEHWSLYDPDASCYIAVTKLYEFVHTLYSPLGFGSDPNVSKEEVVQRIASLKLTNYEGQLHFKDVLKAVSAAALKRVNEKNSIEAAVQKAFDSNNKSVRSAKDGAAIVQDLSEAVIYERLSRGLKVAMDPTEFTAGYSIGSSRGGQTPSQVSLGSHVESGLSVQSNLSNDWKAEPLSPPSPNSSAVEGVVGRGGGEVPVEVHVEPATAKEASPVAEDQDKAVAE